MAFNIKIKNKEIRNRPQVPAGLSTYVRQYVLAMRHGHLAGASLVIDNTLAPESRTGFLVPEIKITKKSLVPGIPGAAKPHPPNQSPN